MKSKLNYPIPTPESYAENNQHKYPGIYSSHVSVSHVGVSWNISNFFIIILSVTVICDWGSLVIRDT